MRNWFERRPKTEKERIEEGVRDELEAAKKASKEAVKRLDSAIMKFRLMTELEAAERTLAGNGT